MLSHNMKKSYILLHGEEMPDKKSRYALIAIIVVAIIGAAILLIATNKWGIGTSPDSATYIGSARHLLRGDGLVMSHAVGETRPMTKTPPMFTLAVALSGLVSGADPIDAARWLHALVFAGAIFLVGFMLMRYTGSFWVALIGAILTMTSVNMLSIHSMAWSEPLFILFTLLWMLQLTKYLDTQKLSTLIYASIAAGLAFFTRYAGAPLIATGFITIILFDKVNFPKKIKNTIIYSLISSLPVTLWIIRNMLIADNATGRTLTFHMIDFNKFLRGTTYAVATWLAPGLSLRTEKIFLTYEIVMLAFFIGVFTVFIYLGVKKFRAKSIFKQTLKDEKPFATLPFNIIVFLVIYTVFFISVICLVDAETNFNTRTLAPVFPLALILSVCLIHNIFITEEANRKLKPLLIAFCAVFIFSYSSSAVSWGVKMHNFGEGYSSVKWRNKQGGNFKFLDKLKTFPPNIRVYSNDRAAVYFLTGIPAASIPPKINATAKLENENYTGQIANIKGEIEAGNAVIVYFSGVDRYFLPNESELIERLPIGSIISTKNGTLYGSNSRR